MFPPTLALVLQVFMCCCLTVKENKSRQGALNHLEIVTLKSATLKNSWIGKQKITDWSPPYTKHYTVITILKILTIEEKSLIEFS